LEITERISPWFPRPISRPWTQKIVNFVLIIDDPDAIKSKDIFLPLVEKQLDQIKLLTAVEHSLSSRDEQNLKLRVAEVRQGMLKKIVTSLDQSNVDVPNDMLKDIKDLNDTYIAKNPDDAEIIDPTLDKLISENRLSFISPSQDLPDDIGVVSIVPVSATGDVRSEEDISGVDASTVDVPSVNSDKPVEENVEGNIDQINTVEVVGSNDDAGADEIVGKVNAVESLEPSDQMSSETSLETSADDTSFDVIAVDETAVETETFEVVEKSESESDVLPSVANELPETTVDDAGLQEKTAIIQFNPKLMESNKMIWKIDACLDCTLSDGTGQ